MEKHTLALGKVCLSAVEMASTHTMYRKDSHSVTFFVTFPNSFNRSSKSNL